MSTGRIHSIQSLGTLDGPGVRFVVFLQGCPLRCACCHNPDTWAVDEGNMVTAEEIVSRALRFREYFGTEGGITLSGGEPLLQADFAAEVFERCHESGINTCLDTSGALWNSGIERLLRHTDRVLLDLKYTSDDMYRQYAGCGIDRPLQFLNELNVRRIPTTIRQVTIPTLNDDEAAIHALNEIIRPYSCVDGVELLPFRKLCETKYEAMKLAFPLAHLPEPSREKMDELKSLLEK